MAGAPLSLGPERPPRVGRAAGLTIRGAPGGWPCGSLAATRGSAESLTTGTGAPGAAESLTTGTGAPGAAESLTTGQVPPSSGHRS